MFVINGNDGNPWAELAIDVRVKKSESYNQFDGRLGKVSFLVGSLGALFPLDWIHVCVSLDNNTGNVKLAVDGMMLMDQIDERALQQDDNRPSSLDMYLGKITDEVKYTVESPGMITNLNVFSSALSQERMEKITSGEECGAPGDTLSWEDAQWTLHSKAKVKMVDSLEVCRKDGPSRWKMQLFAAAFEDHTDCMEHCQKIGGGRAPPVRTLHELDTLREELYAITSDFSALPIFWLAAKDAEVEGEWRDYYTGEAIGNYTKPWYPGHDDVRGDVFNCLGYYTDTPEENAFGERPCFSANMNSCFCQYAHQPVLIMRGLCGQLDRYYIPTQLYRNPNEMIMVGKDSSCMTYNKETSQWKITGAKSNESAVLFGASEVSYGLGKHEWFIENGPYRCNKGRPYSALLKLSGCAEGEFTCDQGQCIQMEER